MPPRVLVLRAPGTNCDRETAFAFETAGALADAVHLNRIHAFGDRHAMRPRDEFAAVNHFRDSVHGQNQILATVALHRGNRIGAGHEGHVEPL